MTATAAEVLLDAGRPSFRGALHCHSTESDGMLAPEAVLAAYGENGYDFVVLTDHYESFFDWRITEPPLGRTPLAIRGLELSSGEWSDRDTVWVNAVGVPAGFGAVEDPLEACRQLDASGAYLSVVHPALNLQMRADLPVLDHVHAVEIHTQSVAGMWPDRASGAYYADALLSSGRRILVNAADDAHFYHPRDRFGAWVEVQAEALEADAITSALRAGSYYSSTGPGIHSLVIEDGSLVVEADPCYSIACTSGGSLWDVSHRSIASEEAVREIWFGDRRVTLNSPPRRSDSKAVVASFELEPYRGSYCRLTIVDHQGRRAWTNPVWP